MLLKITPLILAMVIASRVNAVEVIIQPEKINLECQGSKLNATIDILATLTASKTKLVSASTGGDGLCVAALQYLKLDQPTVSIFQSHITEVDYPINIIPCDLSMSVCSAVYRYSKMEAISIHLKNIELKSKIEIPGSQKEHLVEWDSKICPPYHPDCDL